MELEKIYIYPFESENLFLQKNKDTLAKIGYDVKRIDKKFYKEQLSLKRKSIVILNWLEDYVYTSSERSFFEETKSFVRALAILLISKIGAKKVIWIRHNYQPHNSESSHKRYNFIVNLFKLLNIKPIALESYYSKESVSHPLYKTNAQIREVIGSVDSKELKYDVVFFGAIKRYKNLHNILATWPVTVPIFIAGKCSDEVYRNEILNIITERQLPVEWVNSFFSDEDLNNILLAARYVLIPHADKTMISSGSFYHAITEGCNVLVNDTEFGRFKATQHSFVHLYDPDKTGLQNLRDSYVCRRDVLQEVVNFYGDDIFQKNWEKVLQSM